MVAHLGDQTAIRRQVDQLLALACIEHEGLLAEHVETCSEGASNHGCVRVGRCCDDDGVDSGLGEQLVVVAVHRDAGVLLENIEQEARGVADTGDGDIGMRPNHRQVRQAHFPEAHYADPNRCHPLRLSRPDVVELRRVAACTSASSY